SVLAGKGDGLALTPESEELICRRLLRELEPLFHSKKFGVFLLQLSPGFRPKTHELGELDSLKHILAPHSCVVEVRNLDWVIGPQLEESLDYFSSRQLTFVLVDAPTSEHFTVMPGLDCITNPELGYFRFHGRNEQGYIKGRTVAERFNHDYSDKEV